ncbi:hypothetical protein Golomagni_08375 [Golovinomyces magnicellulatus]|nr:hypothetical protein Golomagni_08375 [Golovinomyces magnicellulatus]
MSSNWSIPQQIRQLNDARKLVLSDVKCYPSVVRGLMPSIGPTAPLELRRWGADFLAEAFATPALPNSEKETMQPYVLTTLESLIENTDQDAQVLRSAIQTASSIYPLALRWMYVDSRRHWSEKVANGFVFHSVNNGYDTVTWERMVGIKQRILKIWDTATPTVKICCIKFAQRVILAQTNSNGAEHRVRITALSTIS